jgi:hypothetical protein
MKMKTQATPAPASNVLDAAKILAAVRAEEHLEKIRAHGGLRETPVLAKLLGTTAITLRPLLAKVRTEFSQGSQIAAGPDDVLAPGKFLLLGIGDRDLVVAESARFAYATPEEAASERPVQDALGLRPLLRSVEVAEAGLKASEQVLVEEQRKVAEATRRREAASDARDLQARSVEREKERLADHLASFGDGGEEKLRAVLGSLKPAKRAAEDDNFAMVARGHGMERVEVSA